MMNKKLRKIVVFVSLAAALLLILVGVTKLDVFFGHRQIEENDPVFLTIKADPGFVFSVTFHPKRNEIMTVGKDGKIKIWDVARRKIKKEITSKKCKYVAAAYSHDGRLIAATSKDRRLHLLAAETGQEVSSIHRNQLSWPTFSPDDRLVAFAHSDSEVELYEISKRRIIGRLSALEKGVSTISFSLDGTLLATGSVNGTIRIWDVKSRKQVVVLQSDSDSDSIIPPCLAFSPEGNTLISGHYDSAIRLWDIKTGQQDCVLYGHKQRVSAVDIRPDGKVFASAGSTEIIVWHLPTGQRRITLRKHDSGITGLSFDSSGCFLASVSLDSNLIVWDLSRLE